MEKDIVVRIEELMDLFDDDEVTTADKIQRPQSSLDREMFQDANIRLNKAGGGMLVQPSADGSRPGYAGEKIKKAAANLNLSVEEFEKMTVKDRKKLRDALYTKKSSKFLGADAPLEKIIQTIYTNPERITNFNKNTLNNYYRTWFRE